MLHRVEKPACLDDMKKLLKYQRRFLRLCLFSPGFTPFQPLNQQIFIDWFGSDIGQWTWERIFSKNNYTKFGKKVLELLRFAQQDPKEVDDIFKKVCHDHQFFVKRQNPDFYFHYSSIGDVWKGKLRPFLEHFYKLFHEPGYPANVFGLGANLNWRTFMDAQDKANPYICPYCDAASGDKTEKLDANDAEHWLPKSIYPHLSIHWANLFRACLACNRTFKGDDNPIKHEGAKELEKTYHPYDKPALDTAQVKASIYTANPQHYCLTLEDDTNPVCATGIDSLLDLSERWRGRMENELQGDKSSLVANEIQLRSSYCSLTESLLKG